MENEDFQIYPYTDNKQDNPKQGDVYGLSFDYKPLFLKGDVSYDTKTGSSNWMAGLDIPFLEKYHMSVGANGYNANYGTPFGQANAYAASPFLSVGYNNFNQNGSGVNAGISYTYGQKPMAMVNYQYRF